MKFLSFLRAPAQRVGPSAEEREALMLRAAAVLGREILNERPIETLASLLDLVEARDPLEVARRVGWNECLRAVLKVSTVNNCETAPYQAHGFGWGWEQAISTYKRRIRRLKKENAT